MVFNAITVEQYETSERYFKLPKLLFESPRYEDMRLDSKVSYSILKDRLSLSLRNNWVDEEGRIYLVYSNTSLMKILKVSFRRFILFYSYCIKNHKSIPF